MAGAAQNREVSMRISLRDRQKFTRETKEAEESVGGIGEKFSELGGKAKAGMLAAVGAVGIGFAGMMKAFDNEAANDKLAGQLGLSPAKAKKYGKVAGKIYAGAWGESIGEVNDVIRSVVSNIPGAAKAGDAALEKLSIRTLDLAGTFDQDAAAITRGVGQMLRTGLAKSSEEAFDIVTRGFQMGADKSEDFLDTLNEYGTQFRKLGVDGATATGIISQGLKAGARDGDLVADALKEFSIRATDGSTTSADAFKAMGLNAKRMTEQIGKGGKPAARGLQTVLDHLRAMKDPVKQQAAAVGIFGTQAEDLGKALYALDPSKATKALGQVDGAAQKLSDTVNDNASANFESFKRQVEQTFVNVVGGTVVPIVSKVAKTLATEYGPALDSSVARMKAFGAWAQKNQAWLVPLVGALATFAVVAKTIATATKIWTSAQIALNIAMTANPVGLIIAGVAALVVGVALLYRKFSLVRIGVLTFAKFGIFALKLFLNYWVGMVETLVTGAAKAFGWVPGLGPKLKAAAEGVAGFRDDVNRKLDGIERELDVKINANKAQRALDKLVSTARVMTSLTGGTISVSQARANLGKARATGGRFTAGQSFLVGERGPEIARFDRSGSINPRPASLRMPAGPGAAPIGGLVAGSDGAAAPQVLQLVVDGAVLAEAVARPVADRRARI